MLMIRYQLVGKKHDHSFRIILTEKRTSPHGKMQERLGFYNPKTKEVKLEKEKITYWIGKGAQPSDSVWNLFVKNGVVKGAKRYIPSAQYKPKAPVAEDKKEEPAPKKEEEAISSEVEAPREDVAHTEEATKAEVPVETPVEEAAPIQEAVPVTENNQESAQAA